MLLLVLNTFSINKKVNKILNGDKELIAEYNDIYDIALRISEQKDITVNYKRVPQDVYLAENQEKEISLFV